MSSHSQSELLEDLQVNHPPHDPNMSSHYRQGLRSVINIIQNLQTLDDNLNESIIKIFREEASFKTTFKITELAAIQAAAALRKEHERVYQVFNNWKKLNDHAGDLYYFYDSNHWVACYVSSKLSQMDRENEQIRQGLISAPSDTDRDPEQRVSLSKKLSLAHADRALLGAQILKTEDKLKQLAERVDEAKERLCEREDE
ncbi:hypothetical protein MMC28_001121 [Mycoblastus sanguinarius]|nr:hypothetical protein [Mycoblastus sanguinarius]